MEMGISKTSTCLPFFYFVRLSDVCQYRSTHLSMKIDFFAMEVIRMEVVLFLLDIAAMVALVYASLRKEKN